MRPWPFHLGLLLTFLFAMGCSRKAVEHADKPRLPSGARLQDVSFFSAALGRTMKYRVIVPAAVEQGKKLPAVYLLHGAGDYLQDWTTNSNIADLATKGMILVIPQGDNSYYANAASKPLFSLRPERYEDYITQDLIQDSEARLPVLKERKYRAIVGASMGGFGALVISMHHPELYSFVAALSPPVDVPERAFNWKRLGQSMGYRRIFGPVGSDLRKKSDPFVLVKQIQSSPGTGVYISFGLSEPLAGPGRRFLKRAEEVRFPVEAHFAPGGHDWAQWNVQLQWLMPKLEAWAQ